MPVDLHADQVHGVGTVKEHRDPVDFVHLVFLFPNVKSQEIRESRASATLHPDAQAMGLGDVLLSHDPLELRHGTGRQRDRMHCRLLLSIRHLIWHISQSYNLIHNTAGILQVQRSEGR